MTSRTPDFVLKVLDKETGIRSGKIGCAWKDEDGGLTIQLDPCVTLPSRPTLLIRLFPNDRGVQPETKGFSEAGAIRAPKTTPRGRVHKAK